jgi:hypothetical protein
VKVFVFDLLAAGDL